jgi:hypothetical protein
MEIWMEVDLAILQSGIYPKECKSSYNRDACTPMFIIALWTAVKHGRQSRFPATNERIRKMWKIYTREYYLAKMKKENWWNWKSSC